MPNVNPTSFASPEAYLDAVRYRPLDSTFSYITSRAANDAFYSDSQFIGFGLSTTVNEVEMRVMQVFPDSPASEAGLSRGDRIVEIGGRPVTALISSGEIGSAFGPSEIGVETGHRIRERGRHAPRVAHGQTAGHDSDRVVDAGLRRGRPPGRLHLLPQFRGAVVRSARRGVRRALGRAAWTTSSSISATTAAGW